MIEGAGLIGAGLTAPWGLVEFGPGAVAAGYATISPGFFAGGYFLIRAGKYDYTEATEKFNECIKKKKECQTN